MHRSRFRFSRYSIHLLWALAGVLFMVFSVILVINGQPKHSSSASNSALATKSSRPSASPAPIAWTDVFLKGSAVTKESALDAAALDPEFQESVLSIMIDNYFAARSQHSGIRSASIVYEALAEGGITRLMLLFPYQELPRVGPIRSAREYFVRWAEEYGGIYVHAGGAPSALQELLNSSLLYQLDEDDRLTGEHYSMRDLRYPEPHNLFVNLLMIRERAKEKAWELDAPRKNWCFDQTNPYKLQATPRQSSGQATDDLALSFSFDPQYDVTFQYDAGSGTYRRYYGKGSRLTPHTDQSDGLQVAPKNVIVQIAGSRLIPGDSKERIEIHDIASGKAFLYRDGIKIEGIWKKVGRGEMTEFLDDQGKPFCLSPGQTWIAVVDSENMIKER